MCQINVILIILGQSQPSLFDIKGLNLSINFQSWNRDLFWQSSSDVRFYESVFPSCLGIGDSWNYDIHQRENFLLNADYEEEYVLHIHNVVQSPDGDNKIVKTKVLKVDYNIL